MIARRSLRAMVAAVAAAATATGVTALASPVADRSAAPTHTAAAKTAATAENAFALALLPRLAGGGNAVYSPYSVAAALSMAGAGARGATQAQIAHTLGAATPAANLANERALRATLKQAVRQGPDSPTLDVANSLWAERTLPVEASFTGTLASDFGAAPYRADFATAPDAARTTINDWVKQHTSGIIPAVLPEGSITNATRFVLANAIYLKAHWSDPFEKSATQKGAFTTAANKRTTVPFMHARATQYPYAGAAHYQAVDLPYASSTLSLLAILPLGESLPALERSLSAAALHTITSRLAPTPVNLAIPKLHLHAQESLNAPLQQLGIRAAFTPAADFSGITTAAKLQIGLVEHAADLRLDEQGTIAAGATVVVGPTAIAVPTHRPVTVDLDRPFLLLLREDASGAILFVAQVADPSAS